MHYRNKIELACRTYYFAVYRISFLLRFTFHSSRNLAQNGISVMPDDYKIHAAIRWHADIQNIVLVFRISCSF